MAEQFYTILTAVGKAKIANAAALGKKVELTELALGDGGGSYYNPTEDQTELRNEVWRGAIGTVDVDGENPNWIIIQTVVPSQHGGFMIREAGVFDDEGDLIAVGKYPETYKPVAADGSIKDLVVRMILEVSNTASVVLKVDPTVILATQQQVNEAEARAKAYTDQQVGEVAQDLAAHKAEKATEDKAGHIKLSDIPLPAIATQSEAEAGTNNTKMMTPLRTHQAIDSRFRWVNGLLEVYMDGKWKRFEERPPIYGVEIDENNSNPETAVVYTDDAVGFTPARGNNGNFDWGSWEDIIKNEFKIRPCVLKNLGGGNAEVNYYLDYDDYTKKADGSAAVLDGTDGDVMIEFGVPLWWKFTRINNKLKIQLSTKSFDGAIKPAFEIEDGYNLVPFYPLTLTQIIYVLMFKNLDSQTALGKGRTDADSYTNTGTTNKKTFCYGSTDATDNVKFLGMEDYFGNRSWRIDGLYYDNNRNMLIGKGNFNDTGSGYENFGQAAPSSLSGYIGKVQGCNNTGFIPASTDGSATTYYCDYGNVYAGRLPSFGGTRAFTSHAGAFYLDSSQASNSSGVAGGRLFYSKDSKIYIGAYLGVNQGGKLRSISGYESHNNATIGEFRTLARANNN